MTLVGGCQPWCRTGAAHQPSDVGQRSRSAGQVPAQPRRGRRHAAAARLAALLLVCVVVVVGCAGPDSATRLPAPGLSPASRDLTGAFSAADVATDTTLRLEGTRVWRDFSLGSSRVPRCPASCGRTEIVAMQAVGAPEVTADRLWIVVDGLAAEVRRVRSVPTTRGVEVTGEGGPYVAAGEQVVVVVSLAVPDRGPLLLRSPAVPVDNT